MAVNEVKEVKEVKVIEAKQYISTREKLDARLNAGWKIVKELHDGTYLIEKKEA